CYGIGVGRAMASVIEQCHDQYGPVWPINIAPYEVHIVALNYNKPPVREAADRLYAALVEAGHEVLLDDRNKKAGFAFSDSDLIGAPFRVVVSPRNLKEGVAELKSRDKTLEETVSLDDRFDHRDRELRDQPAAFTLSRKGPGGLSILSRS
ncbi:MAG: His/Gly/Thr/Pro-type tRNA ligase C-terminal domain-containing protein, partial [Myxococcota bacterium]